MSIFLRALASSVLLSLVGHPNFEDAKASPTSAIVCKPLNQVPAFGRYVSLFEVSTEVSGTHVASALTVTSHASQTSEETPQVSQTDLTTLWVQVENGDTLRYRGGWENGASQIGLEISKATPTELFFNGFVKIENSHIFDVNCSKKIALQHVSTETIQTLEGLRFSEITDIEQSILSVFYSDDYLVGKLTLVSLEQLSHQLLSFENRNKKISDLIHSMVSEFGRPQTTVHEFAVLPPVTTRDAVEKVWLSRESFFRSAPGGLSSQGFGMPIGACRYDDITFVSNGGFPERQFKNHCIYIVFVKEETKLYFINRYGQNAVIDGVGFFFNDEKSRQQGAVSVHN